MINLLKKFLAFLKHRIDKKMLECQRDDSINLTAWKELQAEYKELFGKDYERTN